MSFTSDDVHIFALIIASISVESLAWTKIALGVGSMLLNENTLIPRPSASNFDCRRSVETTDFQGSIYLYI